MNQSGPFGPRPYVRLDTIRWLAHCLGIDNHETVMEILVRPTEVIVVRRIGPGHGAICDHGGAHAAAHHERIAVSAGGTA